MDYGYTPINPIISEVQALYKMFTQMGQLDNDDCLQYAIQALRLIGGNNFETKETFLKVKNYKVVLPQNTYTLRSVRQTSCASSVPSGSHLFVNNNYIIPGQAMMPSESTFTAYCDKDYDYVVPADKSGILKYNYKQPPGILVVPFTDQYIYIKYRFLPQNAEGEYMVQNNEASISAVKKYILFTVLSPLFYTQQIPQYIYTTAKDEWETAERDAKNAQQALGENEVDALVLKQRRKYDRFKLR